MPPVRWKWVVAGLAMCLMHVIVCTDAQLMQDSISMTSDGWRPIVGTRKEPIRDEILHYRNQDGKSIKAETLPATTQKTSTPSKPTPPGLYYKTGGTPRAPPKQVIKQPGKIPAHSKHNPYYPLPNHGAHGPHIPIGAVTLGRPSQNGQLKKYPTSPKPFVQMSLNGKRPLKPIRVQTTQHNGNNKGTRGEEIFTAAQSTGAYTFYKQNNIKTRETLGLGIPGIPGSHYSINQPHAHIEFSNRFAIPPPVHQNENLYQQYNPIQSFVNFKHPQSNDVHYQNQNDDFTRNLVPPPLYQKIKKEPSTSSSIPQNNNKEIIAQLPAPLPQDDNPVQVEITREKLNVFRNNIPQNYNGDYVDYDFHSLKKPITEINKPITYEVTEGNTQYFAQTPKFILRPAKKPSYSSIKEINFPPFLPTPFKPETTGQQQLLPTSPTQSEVSTVFTKLSQKMLPSTKRPYDVNEFHVKEVSTHYPILGRPIFEVETKNEINNDESTTTTTQVDDELTTTTTTTIRPRGQHRRRRPGSRLRTTTTTTTEQPSFETMSMESYESQKTQENSDSSESIENYNRQRRPIRYRTTTRSYDDDDREEITKIRGRHRYRQKPSSNNDLDEPVRKRIKTTTEQPEEIVTEIINTPNSDADDYYQRTRYDVVTTTGAPIPVTKRIRYETIAPIEIEVGTTERLPITNLHLPENEVDETTNSNSDTTTLLTTTTSTTTTTTPKPSSRIRRPIKYDNSNRPRFSVKEYRQKYTPSSTTESYKTTSESYRIRYPNRSRRPLSTTTQSSISNDDDDSTEIVRSRFVPKNPRYGSTNENDDMIEKKVNTRLRPFGRHRSTTVATTTTPKVSIRPNLFANRRRPPMLTLRDRIRSKNNNNNSKTNDEEKTTTTEETIASSSDEDVENATVEDADVEESKTEDVESTTSSDILKNDAVMYSQRVSDLTSSFKDEYNTPGLFKNVAPTSRRVPSHFTIATDDPILPIEAFFPNIKDKDKQ